MLIAFLAALAAAAPTASPALPLPATGAQADPAAVAEALHLMEEEGFEEEALRTSEMTLELVMATMAEQIQKRTNEPIPADFLAQLQTTIRDHQRSTLRANMGSIKQQAAAIYAQEFTREELVRLRELSKDPVMRKARERMKVMGPKLMALGAYTMRAAEPELEAKIQRLVTDYLARQGKSDNRS